MRTVQGIKILKNHNLLGLETCSDDKHESWFKKPFIRYIPHIYSLYSEFWPVMIIQGRRASNPLSFKEKVLIKTFNYILVS